MNCVDKYIHLAASKHMFHTCVHDAIVFDDSAFAAVAFNMTMANEKRQQSSSLNYRVELCLHRKFTEFFVLCTIRMFHFTSNVSSVDRKKNIEHLYE